jgi:hypothetical protein
MFKNTGSVFVNVYGAQELIPPAFYSLAGRYNKLRSRTGSPGWESISVLLERFTNMGSVSTAYIFLLEMKQG